MADLDLHQCYFCEGFFSATEIRRVNIHRNPSSLSTEVYSCEDCMKTPKMERLLAKAQKALQDTSLTYAFNEIELADGNFKVHLIRLTPVPYTVPPFPFVMQK